jgi:hypothetical protein
MINNWNWPRGPKEGTMCESRFPLEKWTGSLSWCSRKSSIREGPGKGGYSRVGNHGFQEAVGCSGVWTHPQGDQLLHALGTPKTLTLMAESCTPCWSTIEAK